MVRAAVLVAGLAAANAFVVPAPRMGRRGLVQMAVQDMIGADVETKGVWDPLNFSKNEESLYRYRQVELKHGRVAMIAIIGTLVQTFYSWPDEVFNNHRPLGALSQILAERPVAFWQIFLTIGAIELTIGKQDETKAPGDLGFGEDFKPTDADAFSKLQTKELKNGRLAMLATIGQFVQEKLTGQGPIEQLLAGHISPFGDGQGAF